MGEEKQSEGEEKQDKDGSENEQSGIIEIMDFQGRNLHSEKLSQFIKTDFVQVK
jgi:hypothetical protein